MTRIDLRAALAATLAAGLLAGCGGDSDSPVATAPAPVTQVPASAAANDAALEAFAIGQAQTETAEPLTLDLVTTFPSSETEEPIAVN